MSTGDPWSFSLRNSLSWDDESPQGSPTPLNPSSSQKSEDDARIPPPNPFSIAKVNAAIRDANQPTLPPQSSRTNKPNILPQKGVLALVRKQADVQDAKRARGFRPSGNPTRKASTTKENAPEGRNVGKGLAKDASTILAANAAPVNAHTTKFSPKSIAPHSRSLLNPTAALTSPPSALNIESPHRSLEHSSSGFNTTISTTRSRIDAIFSPRRTGLPFSQSSRETVTARATGAQKPAVSLAHPTSSTPGSQYIKPTTSGGSSLPSSANSDGPSRTLAPHPVRPGRFSSPLMSRQHGAPTAPASSIPVAGVNTGSDKFRHEVSHSVSRDDYSDRRADQTSGAHLVSKGRCLVASSPVGVNTAVPGTSVGSNSGYARDSASFDLGKARAQTLSPRQRPGNTAPPPRKRLRPSPHGHEDASGHAASYSEEDFHAHLDSDRALTRSDLAYTNAHDARELDGSYSDHDTLPGHSFAVDPRNAYDSRSAMDTIQDAELSAEATQVDPGLQALDDPMGYDLHEAPSSTTLYSQLHEDEPGYSYAPSHDLGDDMHDFSSDLSMSSLQVLPPSVDALGPVQFFSYGPARDEGHAEWLPPSRDYPVEDRVVYDEDDREPAPGSARAYRATGQRRLSSPLPTLHSSTKRGRSPSMSLSPSPPPKRRAPASKPHPQAQNLSAYAHPAFATDPDAGWSTLPPRASAKSTSKLKSKGGKFTIPLGRLLGGGSANAEKVRAKEVEAWKRDKEDVQSRERGRNVERDVASARRVTVYRPPPRK
ncbi:unnamed protein product [Peniophora sp. CBMAI 1063]|nr:unnamed protein product [Peniophora sp. CBMAI 1063]